jgi:hypothetical protein
MSKRRVRLSIIKVIEYVLVDIVLRIMWRPTAYGLTFDLFSYIKRPVFGGP